MTRRLRFVAWDKDYVRKGEIGKIISADLTARHNTLGSCSFTIAANHRRVADLSADGARVAVDYYPDKGFDPIRIYSGEVTGIHGEGRAEQATRTYTVTDDWNVLNTTLGYPNPTGGDTEQGTSEYYVSTGPAETVVLDVIGANATRAGIDLAVPISLGRGPTITVKLRMHPLADRLFPAVDQAGIGVRIIQQGSQRSVVVYQPVTYPRVLTEASKLIQGTSFDLTRATVTRPVVGAGGESVARVFRSFPDTVLQSQLGTVLESFVDARDVDPAAPDLSTQLQQRADAAKTDGAAKASMDVTLVERGAFRFGKTFNLGDRVSVQMNNGPVITDLVRAVQITQSVESGVLVTPMVGDWADQAGALPKFVAALAVALRDLKRR